LIGPFVYGGGAEKDELLGPVSVSHFKKFQGTFRIDPPVELRILLFAVRAIDIDVAALYVALERLRPKKVSIHTFHGEPGDPGLFSHIPYQTCRCNGMLQKQCFDQPTADETGGTYNKNIIRC
jgi:hypothetical protein